jgi:DHA2 family multidrug resistance protein-like MFS transporter
MNAAYGPSVASLAGVPASASSAAAHSLGEAYQEAERLGGPVGDLLRTTARHSFVNGLHVTLLVSAGLLLIGAFAALRLPRVMECAAEGRREADVPAARRPEATAPAEPVPAGRRPERPA